MVTLFMTLDESSTIDRKYCTYTTLHLTTALGIVKSMYLTCDFWQLRAFRLFIFHSLCTILFRLSYLFHCLKSVIFFSSTTILSGTFTTIDRWWNRLTRVCILVVQLNPFWPWPIYFLISTSISPLLAHFGKCHAANDPFFFF